MEVKHGDNSKCCAKKTLAFAWVVSLRLAGKSPGEREVGLLMGLVLLNIYTQMAAWQPGIHSLKIVGFFFMV